MSWPVNGRVAVGLEKFRGAKAYPCDKNGGAQVGFKPEILVARVGADPALRDAVKALHVVCPENVTAVRGAKFKSHSGIEGVVWVKGSNDGVRGVFYLAQNRDGQPEMPGPKR